MSRLTTVAALGTAQTLAWASSYYLPAMLAVPIALDLGMAPSTVFAAFSVALIVSAALGPYAGRAIDRFGGRPVLIASNLVFAAGLAALGWADSTPQLFLAWALIGIAMGSGLYEAAFATVVRLHGQEARSAITGITLFAGFASTVGWPVSAALESHFGWRGACMAWAGLHLLIGLPLNACLPRLPRANAADAAAPAKPEPAALLSEAEARRAAFLMAYVFAVTWFISTAMAAHLPSVLQAVGVGFALAVSFAALVGPAQVAGRVLEFTVLQRFHPLLSARLAAMAHPLGAVAIGLAGAPAAAVFTVLHGAGNGILTIAIGTLPLLLFGSQGYGRRQGLLMVPARLVQAGAPFLFGLSLDRWGAGALWLSALLGLSACAALWWMPAGARSSPAGGAR
ncbi:Predicted arabinose efflux permease, MFS family [Variovorax sp. CF079]|uniref:MFS transporter n=1 Tax=Variovorax sp. CF079 TaxID=1882774 RepID=UPI00088F64F2|nr:MFS transporter [Variovorax sp. CF079]SDE24423.1 Predicted arabinose efflux permease, MFS family [Variovorax sp. CF079]